MAKKAAKKSVDEFIKQSLPGFKKTGAARKVRATADAKPPLASASLAQMQQKYLRGETGAARAVSSTRDSARPRVHASTVTLIPEGASGDDSTLSRKLVVKNGEVVAERG